ncbi:MAG: alpha amylase C-terminal domain-containing protein, partial [Verrucomicrobiia bacterium]
TDAGFYGGSDVGNAGGVVAEPVPQAGRPHSIKVTLPPLGALMIKHSGLPTLPAPPPKPTETSDAP